MTKRPFTALALGCSLITAAHAASPELSEYLTLRRQHLTSAAAQVPDGQRISELNGIVSGIASGGGPSSTIMFEAEDKQVIVVKAMAIPDWMKIGHVHARLLVRITRPDEIQAPSYDMIGAVPKELYDRWEQEQPKRPAKPASPGRAAIARGGRASRTITRTSPPNLRPGAWTASRSLSGWTTAMTQAFPYYAAEIARRNSRLSAQEVERIAASIIQFSVQCRVDARLIMAMVVAESGFNPRATSRAGAMGLGQLMPGTARGMGVVNAYDPEENLAAAIRIIGGHMKKYGGSPECMNWDQIRLTMAAYNAGSGAVKKYGGVPPYRETQNYVKRVIALFKAYSGFK